MFVVIMILAMKMINHHLDQEIILHEPCNIKYIRIMKESNDDDGDDGGNVID